MMANAGIYDEDSDDLDSILAAESDTDSNFEDFPTDGHFTERPRSGGVVEADSKARDRTEQRAGSSGQRPPSHMRSTTSSPTSIDWTQAGTSYVNPEAPPPNYEAATASRPATQASSHPASATQFRQQPDQVNFIYSGNSSGAFNASSEPSRLNGNVGDMQSMSDPRQGSLVDEETGLLANRSERRRKRWCGPASERYKRISTCDMFVGLAVMMLIVLLTAASSSATSGDGEGNHGNGTHGKNPTFPITNPDLPHDIPHSPNCAYEYYSDNMVFEFHKPGKFTFGEFIERYEFPSLSVSGNVVIQPGEKNQKADINLLLTFATTKQMVESNFVKTDESFVLQTPELEGDAGRWPNACVYVSVRIEVRPGVTLESWDLTASNLNIDVQDGLFNRNEQGNGPTALEISTLSSFTTVRGKADITHWSSRETIVETISGSITGTFALHDALTLKSQSGLIKASIAPQPHLHHLPAKSLFQTVSGHITAHFPTSDQSFPERKYITRVESSSGALVGSYILGAHTRMTTQSGTIAVDLSPGIERGGAAKLVTDTRSGLTRVNVLQPSTGFDWADAMVSQASTSTSGAVKVVYPQAWEGVIQAKSLAGAVEIGGEGVKIVESGGLGPGKRVKAVKGSGRNTLVVEAVSGMVGVLIGQE